MSGATIGRAASVARLSPLHLIPEPVELLERRLPQLDAALGGEAFERLEAGAELPVRPLQGGEGVGAGEAGEVHDGEEEVAELFLQRGRRFRCQRLPHLLQLLGHLLERAARVGPVEADRADPFLDAVRAGKRVQPSREVREDRAPCAALLRLQRLPRLGFALPVDMRVATSHLFLEAADDRLRVEGAALFGEHDLERDVQEQVAELAAERFIVAVADRLGDLVRLLEQVGEE